MRMTVLTLSLALTVALWPCVAAADACGDILRAGLFNTRTDISQSQLEEARKSYYCIASLTEAKKEYAKEKSSSGAGGASFQWNPFGKAGGSMSQSQVDSLTESSWESMKSSNCGSDSAEKKTADYQYHTSAVAASEVTSAWLKCMTQSDGLSCWVDPQTREALTLQMWFRRRPGSKIGAPQLELATLKGGRSDWKGAQDGELVPDGWPILEGGGGVPVSRTGRDAISAFLQIADEGVRHSCAWSVPALPEEARPPPPIKFPKPKPTIEVGCQSFGCPRGDDTVIIVDPKIKLMKQIQKEQLKEAQRVAAGH